MSKEPATQANSVIIARLINEGWTTSQFGKTFHTASLQYSNGKVRLELEYQKNDESVFLRIVDRIGRDIGITIRFGDKLDQILEQIISVQDAISTVNYKNQIRKILRICPSTYLDVDGKLVPLADEENG